ncbi:hypothetical protein ILUMI_10009 [Ignelater luminosus]|uniref:Uncharacterized protein n=1 Tax=Ignelater luminosus TaxID=2038154 RepID=A0A8K0D338_IGNLU|nr:hypothetical protein ILUMI_10009 [Ignelater luminosus]
MLVLKLKASPLKDHSLTPDLMVLYTPSSTSLTKTVSNPSVTICQLPHQSQKPSLNLWNSMPPKKLLELVPVVE